MFIWVVAENSSDDADVCVNAFSTEEKAKSFFNGLVKEFKDDDGAFFENGKLVDGYSLEEDDNWFFLEDNTNSAYQFFIQIEIKKVLLDAYAGGIA